MASAPALDSDKFSRKSIWKTYLEKRYGEDKLSWDKGTSPVFAGGNLVVAVMHTEGDSYLVSLDKKTGEEIWKTPRNYETAPESSDAYTTPQVLEIDGIENLSKESGERAAYSPQNTSSFTTSP